MAEKKKIQWHEFLYMDEPAKEKAGEIMKKIEEGEMEIGLWIITKAASSFEQLDLYSCRMFLRENTRREMYIVGLAYGNQAAKELLLKMAWDAYEATGDCDLRTWFSEK